jgi:dTDP-glucose 4,6-dehydratase/UDP-glucose 4-epimerase
MKILIIGSSGFIGSHLVQYFYNLGHLVTGSDIKSTENVITPFILLKNEKTEFSSLFNKSQFDICINASGSASVPFSLENPSEDFRLNVSNVNSILHSIRIENAKCKFINFSSAAVYGNPKTFPIKEGAILSPVSPYGFHKMISEQICNEFSKLYDIRTISLRVFSAYGPGLKKQLFWDFYNKSLIADEIELFGTGEETRDFIFIDDLCKAVECIIHKAPMNGESINIASGIETTIKSAIETYIQIYKPNLKFSFNGKTKKGDPKNWEADITKLKLYGFIPSTNIHHGLNKYIEWISNI